MSGVSREEIASFLGYENIKPQDIDLALRILVDKGLVELSFGNKDFCFKVTEKGDGAIAAINDFDFD